MEYEFRIPIPSSVWIFLAIIIVIVFLVLLLTIIPIIGFSITLTRDQLKASSPIMLLPLILNIIRMINEVSLKT